MKKLFAIAVLMVLATAPMAFAAGVALSNTEMDQIAAGDWVVLTDPSGNQSVVDVYATNNTLDLLANSQVLIQAVNNVNAVDSAVGVATNIASVTGTPSINVAINGSNKADLKNYRPAVSSGESKEKSSSEFSTKSEGSSKSSDLYKAEGSHSSSAYGYVETNDVNVVVTGSSSSASSGPVEGQVCDKGCQSSSSSASASSLVALLISDYDKFKVKSSSESSSSVEEVVTVFGFEKSETEGRGSVCKTSKSDRSNAGQNNHLAVDQTSQEFLQGVTNLNVVASGAAAQTNIASNVGVTGSITHVNSAAVGNGF